MKIGKFRILHDMLRDPTLEAAFLSLFGNCIPVEIEHRFYANELEYTCLSPLFDDVPLGQIPPNYILNLATDLDTGKMTMPFLKVPTIPRSLWRDWRDKDLTTNIPDVPMPGEEEQETL